MFTLGMVAVDMPDWKASLAQINRDAMVELVGYHMRHRAKAIREYKAATLWVSRTDARMWALHHGKLLRRMNAHE